jgi:hypothetical protein
MAHARGAALVSAPVGGYRVRHELRAFEAACSQRDAPRASGISGRWFASPCSPSPSGWRCERGAASVAPWRPRSPSRLMTRGRCRRSGSFEPIRARCTGRAGSGAAAQHAPALARSLLRVRHPRFACRAHPRAGASTRREPVPRRATPSTRRDDLRHSGTASFSVRYPDNCLRRLRDPARAPSAPRRSASAAS